MSTVIITMGTQPKDFGAVTLGSIELNLNIQGQVFPLDLELSPVSGYGRFREVIWFDPQTSADIQQQTTYSEAISRDFKNLGGSNNVKARVVPAGIEVSARVGTFSDGLYTGFLLTPLAFTYNNTLQEDPLQFITSKTGVGSCTLEGFRATSAQGGVPPYRMTANGTELFNGWDGASDAFFDLQRATTYKLQLLDSLGDTIKDVTLNPTKNLQATDFDVTLVPLGNFSDILVSIAVSRPGTTPLEYRLVDENLVATAWGSATVFGGTPEGLYELQVRDVYECAVSKQVRVEYSPSNLQQKRVDYFSVSEFNSLSFYNEQAHGDEIRKNYLNTPNWKDRVNLPKSGAFGFSEGPPIATQFRSTYPAHLIGLHRLEQEPLAVPFFLIQENLGVKERVDCRVFPVSQSLSDISGQSSPLTGTGVYFNGGDKYEPDSTVVIDDSPYLSGLPPWAEVGTAISFEGIGSFEIVETDLFDETLGVAYFRLDASIAEQDAIIQTTWDRHPYNVYKFSIDRELFAGGGAFIRILPGTQVNGDFLIDLDKVSRSERFFKVASTDNLIKITWSAFRNIGEMLFTDGTLGEMWLKGRVRPFSSSSAEFDDSDEGSVSIDQTELLRMRGYFPTLSSRQWRKLGLVGTIGNRGNVEVEGMELVRISAMEQEELEQTNLSTVTVDFAFSGESTSISQEDPVYSLDTGGIIIPSGGPLSGRTGESTWEVNGNRLTDSEGNFIKVMDNGVEKYVEIN
jgi:hypothetical protein